MKDSPLCLFFSVYSTTVILYDNKLVVVIGLRSSVSS